MALSKQAKREVRVARAKERDASAKDKAWSRGAMAAGAVVGQQGPLKNAKIGQTGASVHVVAGGAAALFDMVRRPSNFAVRRVVDLAVGAGIGELAVWSHNNSMPLFPGGNT